MRFPAVTLIVHGPGPATGELKPTDARLRDVTGADELLVTTIAHDHAGRVRSYGRLAAEWEGGAVTD